VWLNVCIDPAPSYVTANVAARRCFLSLLSPRRLLLRTGMEVAHLGEHICTGAGVWPDTQDLVVPAGAGGWGVPRTTPTVAHQVLGAASRWVRTPKTEQQSAKFSRAARASTYAFSIVGGQAKIRPFWFVWLHVRPGLAILPSAKNHVFLFRD
jgi:hypothetical protein